MQKHLETLRGLDRAKTYTYLGIREHTTTYTGPKTHIDTHKCTDTQSNIHTYRQKEH